MLPGSLGRCHGQACGSGRARSGSRTGSDRWTWCRRYCGRTRRDSWWGSRDSRTSGSLSRCSVHSRTGRRPPYLVAGTGAQHDAGAAADGLQVRLGGLVVGLQEG